MDELGHILREARETKGLTLAEVQQEIRINVKFLEALENGQYERLPTPVHVRGFLKNYARFLGLDPDPLLNRYELNQNNQQASATYDGKEVPSDVLVPAGADQPFFDPVNVEVDVGYRRDPESVLRLIIIVALLASIALVANRFIPRLRGEGDGSEATSERINEVLQDIMDDVNGTAEEPALSPSPAATTVITPGGVITSTSRNIAPTLLPTPSATRPILPALETIRLRLEITERTWMEVTIDGDVQFSGIARRGDPPYEFEAQEEAKVRTGNAIGIFVTINDDIKWGRLGGRGEATEQVWTTTETQQ